MTRARLTALALLAGCGGGGDGTDADDEPCALVCEASGSVLLTTPGEGPDLAASELPVSGCGVEGYDLSPAITEPGTYTVEISGYLDGPSPTPCTTELTAHEAYPVLGARIISARRDGADTVAVLAWDPRPGSEVAQVEIRLDDDGDGIGFETIATVDVDVGTFELPAMTSPRATVAVVSLATTGEAGGWSRQVPLYAIEDDAYNLSEQAVPGVGFDTSLYAVVRAPATDEARPLVVFLHGNHENCIGNDEVPFCDDTDAHECSGDPFPNAEGYIYLMETLAAQGYMTASLSANAINCRADGIYERTQLILEHLRRWKSWTSAAPGAPFQDGRFTGRVDLSRVSVVGHSRGGEAAAGVPTALADTPIAGVALESVLAIAPTDFYQPDPGATTFGLMLPACDGDVYDLQGKGQYDRALAADTPALRSQVFMLGANHNFFNTEWTFDDTDYAWGGGTACRPAVRAGDVAQRAVMEDYLGRFLEAAGGAALAPYLRADATVPDSLKAWAGDTVRLRPSYASDDRVHIDDFAPPLGTNELGGDVDLEGLAGGTTCESECYLFEHQLDAIRVGIPQASDASVRLHAPGGLDVSGGGAISMRVAARYGFAEPAVADAVVLAFAVEVTDGAGVTVQVLPDAAGPLPIASDNYWSRELLSTVRVTAAQLRDASADLDLSDIQSIAVVGIGVEQPAAVFWLTNVELDPGT